MTRKEAINLLADMDSDKYTAKEAVALTMAIEALDSSENPNTCGDAISREAAEDAIAEMTVNGESLGYAVAYDILSDLPSVTPQQRTGRWIDVGSMSCRCNKCGCKNNKLTRFCPDCGAKMEVEGEIYLYYFDAYGCDTD